MFINHHNELASSRVRAENFCDTWTVTDGEGGRWWPNDATAAVIDSDENPAREALRICAAEPTRGTWHW